MYFIGFFDRSLITTLPRMDAYTEGDYDLIARFIASFEAIVTTPHILTEVSNLSTTALGRKFHRDYLTLFARSIELIVEEWVPSKEVARLPIFTRLALADAASEAVARDKYLVMSADLPLVAYLESQGVAVINFNHLRELAWQ